MKIYGDYDRAALDKQYDARAASADAEGMIKRYPSESARVRERFRGRLGLNYGPTRDETLDVFPAAAAGAPVHVFIHGGYWRMMHKDDVSRFAELFVPAGAAYVAVNYSLAPLVTIDEIVRQCRAALAWVYRNAESFGGDPRRIFVSGHSAGGHLAGMMLATDWKGVYGLPADLVTGATAVSGLFDLEPIRLCHVNDWARLDADSARRNSPIHHLPARGCPLVLSVGGRETDEFHRQTRIYGDAWRARGFACTDVAMPDRDHFTVMDDLGVGESALAHAMIAQMELG